MNYRHIFHAGNFADVHKHLLLIQLLMCFTQKDKPFVYIDTHAGLGMYDLSSEQATRNPEYLTGIHELLNASDVPNEARHYLDIVRKTMVTTDSMRYPGSPWLARQCLRAQDEMILNEKHPDDALSLNNLFKRDRQVHCHQRDAYECLLALLPPKIRRAIILIDPPYEDKHEFSKLFDLITKAFKLFPQGCYMLWYPIKDDAHIPFIQRLQHVFGSNCLVDEYLKKDLPDDAGLCGSGVVIINPPWQFAEKIEPITTFLNR